MDLNISSLFDIPRYTSRSRDVINIVLIHISSAQPYEFEKDDEFDSDVSTSVEKWNERYEDMSNVV